MNAYVSFKNLKMHYKYYFREMINFFLKKRDIEEKWKLLRK
jgi:hypothetical protein